MKLTKEQVMVAKEMQARGTSVRRLAKQLGVNEGTLRYRFRRQGEAPSTDGRAQQRTALDGLEDAVHAIQERLGDGRLNGEGRPAQVLEIYRALVRDHGYRGSAKAVARHLNRRYGKPRIRAVRRVETPAGVQAQHDWFEVKVPIGAHRREVQALVGTLSHSRARFCWVSEDQSQLSWHTGHLALFERYGGVPLWIRIDNLKTGMAWGAGSHGQVNPIYKRFADACGFQIDPCRPAMGSDKGKAERTVRTFRGSFGEVLRRGAGSMEELQVLLDAEADLLLDRLECPVTGTSVREAWEAERTLLLPLPTMAEPFDLVVTRKVSRDCLVSFEGRRYSVPFAWVGRMVDVWGTHACVVVRAEGQEIARHARGTRERLLIDPRHYEGSSTDRVERPTPLGERARLQLAGFGRPTPTVWLQETVPVQLARPIEAYAQLVEALR